MTQRSRFNKEIVDGEECFEPYAEEPCNVCDEPTGLRCGCTAVVCYRCLCPNGCDAPIVAEQNASMTQVLKGGLTVFDELDRGWQKGKC
jgi:hypothetical protein